MRPSTPSALIALMCFAALGSGGCLLVTSLSDLTDAVAATADSAAPDVGPDAPGASADAAAKTDGAGVPAVEIVARDEAGITAIAVHSDGLYYVRPQAQSLYRVAPADLGPTARGKALITGRRIVGVAVTTLDVFVTVDTTPAVSDACVLRAKHDGSGIAPLIDYCLMKGHPATSPAAVFFFGVDSGANNGVWRIEMATGVAGRSYTGARTNGGEILSGVAYGGADVFVSNQATSTIARLTSGTTAADFATGQSVVDIVAEGTTVYWITQEGSVRSFAVGTSGPPRDLAKLTAPQRIAIDETSLYVTTSGLSASTGTVVRIAKDTGAKTELAKGLANPSAIALDANAVYWANIDDGTIMRIARK